MRTKISGFIETIKDELEHVNRFIYKNPEEAYHEYKAQSILTETLEKYGFRVEKNFLGLGTEFRASFGEGSPAVAFLCEYDALPGIGHGCGHNIIASSGVGAAIGLSRAIGDTGGRVVVLGTPAEETSGAKVRMAESGVFDDIDAAIMVHPSTTTSESGTSLALDALEFTFNGRAAHASSYPERGINALSACIQFFNMVDALRSHLKPDVRIHGIITEGGTAPNIVPERAVARFYVRSLSSSYLNEVSERVKNCAACAASGLGAEVEIRNFELSYANMVTNVTLSRIFSHNLKESGIIDIYGPRQKAGSIDMGNVSHVCPAIHPYIKTCEKDIAPHTREFAAATITDYAVESMISAAKAMALTGYDIITNCELLREIKDEFGKQKSLF